MYQNFKQCRSLFGALFFIALFLPVSIFAQIPIAPNTWTGQGTSAPGPSAFTVLPASATPGAAVVNVSQWNRAASMTNTTAGGCYNTSNWQIGGSLATAQANNKYIWFTITNDAATELRVTELFIMSQVSATGPHNVQMAYAIGAGPDVLFGAPVATAHTATPENWTITGNMCVAPSQTVTFKLYGWGGSGAAGTLRIYNGTSITAFFAPGITAISATNSSPVCAGNLLSFTGSFTGGVPGYTFSWTGPDAFSSALLSPSISSPTPAASGVYTFTVTDALTCTASSTFATTTVTVTAAPAPISGVAEVCEGQTTTLSDTDPGGSWSSDATGIADVGTSTGIVTGILAGTATITYSIGTSCIATVVVTVKPTPQPITGANTICQGFTTPFSDATPGGTWTSGAPAIVGVGILSGVVTGIAPGTGVITYTLPSGCFVTRTVTVYAFPAAITGPSNVCSGATITLADATPGGTWSSLSVPTASVDAAGIVTGGTAGNTSIVYTLPGGCSVSHPVTVNPLPAPVTGAAVICVNATTTLASATPLGTWSSSDPTRATVSATGVVFGVSAGTVTISYILSTGCFQVRTMTINAIPNPITGPAGVCIGSTITLGNTMPGGTWTSSNTGVATIGLSSGIVSTVAVGTTTITYMLSATGCFVTRTEVVNPLPGTITGASSGICPGTTITLTDLPAGGAWSSSPIAIATVNTATGDVTGVAEGTATITYTLTTGCTATAVVTVNPAPPSVITAIGDTVMCPGDFVLLSANTGAGFTYQWLIGGAPIPGAATSLYTAVDAGSYQVEITNTLGCTTRSVPVTVSINAATAVITAPGGVLSGCASIGILLTANTGAGLSYQWVAGGVPVPGATNSTYTAMTTDFYSVVVTNLTGCSAVSSSVAVTILPSPGSGVAVTGPVSFCQGGSSTLIAAGGSGYTYQWYSATGPIPGATNMTYNVTASGNYWAKVTNSFGCVTSSIVTPILVNPLPNVSIASSGPKVFCTGGSVMLSVAVVGPYYYQWYKGGTPIAGATNATYLATTTGGYRVKIINTATGCTDMTHADSLVTSVDTPVITPLTSAIFCWGGSTHLATSISSITYGVNYQWLLNGVPIPGATTSTWHTSIPGNYSCTISIPSSCTVTTAEIPAIEKPLPDPVITFNGSILSTGTFYTSYQWYKNLAMITGAVAPTTVPTGNGSYKVFVTDTNGCHSASTAYVLTGWHGTAGVNNIGVGDVKIFPNPAHTILHVTSSHTLRAIISSIEGKVMADQLNARDIDISSFANGVYMISFYDEMGYRVHTDQFVKM